MLIHTTIEDKYVIPSFLNLICFEDRGGRVSLDSQKYSISDKLLVHIAACI